jgi:hypothetical protein
MYHLLNVSTGKDGWDNTAHVAFASKEAALEEAKKDLLHYVVSHSDPAYRVVITYAEESAEGDRGGFHPAASQMWYLWEEVNRNAVTKDVANWLAEDEGYSLKLVVAACDDECHQYEMEEIEEPE